MDGLALNMSIFPFCEKFGLATLSLRVQDLLNYTAIDPLVQRKLSAGQRRKIANYLLERELDHVFFGPVTLSLRDVNQLAKEGEGLYLRHGSKLSILDGQHRIQALGHVNEQMLKEKRSGEKKAAALKVKQRKQPDNLELSEELEQLEGLIAQVEARRLDLMETELSAQLYIGFSEEEEKQLFGDINSKVQLVSKELGHSFDSTDPLNRVIQQAVDHNVFLKAAGVEKRSSLTAFNKNFTSYSWLYSTACMLFSGRMQPSYELARRIRKQLPSYVEMLHQFFNAVLPYMPEQPGLASFTSSSRVMQESLALFAHRHLFDGDKYREGWTESLRMLENFDWTQDNEELAEAFGRMDNGKLNLIHEKSLRKHGKLVELFEERLRGKEKERESAAG